MIYSGPRHLRKKADYASLKLDPDTATLGKLRRLLRMVFQSRWRICAPLEAIEIWIDGTSCKEETKTLSELGLEEAIQPVGWSQNGLESPQGNYFVSISLDLAESILRLPFLLMSVS